MPCARVGACFDNFFFPLQTGIESVGWGFFLAYTYAYDIGQLCLPYPPPIPVWEHTASSLHHRHPNPQYLIGVAFSFFISYCKEDYNWSVGASLLTYTQMQICVHIIISFLIPSFMK